MRRRLSWWSLKFLLNPTDGLFFPYAMTLFSDVSRLAECFDILSRIWSPDELARVADDIGDSRVYLRLISKDALRHFLDNSKIDWDEHDFEQMASQFLTHWPQEDKLRTGHITAIKAQLVRSGIVVPYRLLRPFILETVYNISLNEVNGTGGQGCVVAPSLNTVKRVTEGASSV
ncbi:hypothetical protein B0T17DRAFT_33083 [Bombardia bombarda]|uniref:Uncharacterized protein n=1 Tax=Bombardia bombarda TaxID=252184 RepID=A0AA39XK96_9PEZI|nr:hypothetical protein B0T17DRAFT_33083 [Bombardia bombarda]